MNVSIDQILTILGEEVVKNRLLERENATLREELQKIRDELGKLRSGNQD